MLQRGFMGVFDIKPDRVAFATLPATNAVPIGDDSQPRKSLLERLFSIVCDVRPGEGPGALILTINLFMLLGAYYLGEGSNSSKDDRSDFRSEFTSAHFGGQLHLIDRKLSAGYSVGGLLVNVGPGDLDNWPSTDKIFNEANTPGLEKQSNFITGTASVAADLTTPSFSNPKGLILEAQDTQFWDKSALFSLSSAWIRISRGARGMTFGHGVLFSPNNSMMNSNNGSRKNSRSPAQLRS